MCGINGIFAYHYAANPVDRVELLRTRDHMAARGPDGKGDWLSEDGRIGFGHRRLSIIDLSQGGAQPMQSADGRLVISFNGEVYTGAYHSFYSPEKISQYEDVTLRRSTSAARSIPCRRCGSLFRRLAKGPASA